MCPRVEVILTFSLSLSLPPPPLSLSLSQAEAKLARRGSRELQEQTHRLQDSLRTKFHTLLLPLVTRAHGLSPPAAGVPAGRVAEGAAGKVGSAGAAGAGGRGEGLFAEGALVFERYLWAIAAVSPLSSPRRASACMSLSVV